MRREGFSRVNFLIFILTGIIFSGVIFFNIWVKIHLQDFSKSLPQNILPKAQKKSFSVYPSGKKADLLPNKEPKERTSTLKPSPPQRKKGRKKPVPVHEKPLQDVILIN